MLSRDLLEHLIGGIDWETIRQQSDLPTEYNGYPSTALIASHTLPYLLPLPSERALARELLENEFLQRLCGFHANINREEPAPSRATLWHFRARHYGGFQKSLIRGLVGLFVKSRDLYFDPPFVSFVQRGINPQLAFTDSFGLQVPSVHADVTAIVPPSREPRIIPERPEVSQLRLDLLRQKGDPTFADDEVVIAENGYDAAGVRFPPREKLGIAEHVGLPAIVNVETPGSSPIRMCFEAPDWLYTGLQDRDRLMHLGPSYENRPYAACNILVPRIRDGIVHVLLAERLAGTGAGQYAMPGGKCKPDERIQDCAKRELWEETGLQLIYAQPISCHRRRGSQAGPLVTSVGVLATECVGEASRKERRQHGEWEWVPIDSLPDNLFIPARLVLDAYNSGLAPLFSWHEIDDAASPQQPSLFETDLTSGD